MYSYAVFMQLFVARYRRNSEEKLILQITLRICLTQIV